MRLIDADALKDFFSNIQEHFGAERISFRSVNRAIDAIPTIEPKRGDWKLFYESKDGDNVYKCSYCRFITVIPDGIKLFSFCPNCGADMRKESE